MFLRNVASFVGQRFLAAVYNGHEFHFDLTDLGALDTDLANACIDYLNYDRLSKAEVHTHLPDGGRQMQWFISQHGIRPRLHLSSYDEHEAVNVDPVRHNAEADPRRQQSTEREMFLAHDRQRAALHKLESGLGKGK